MLQGTWLFLCDQYVLYLRLCLLCALRTMSFEWMLLLNIISDLAERIEILGCLNVNTHLALWYCLVYSHLLMLLYSILCFLWYLKWMLIFIASHLCLELFLFVRFHLRLGSQPIVLTHLGIEEREHLLQDGLSLARCHFTLVALVRLSGLVVDKFLKGSGTVQGIRLLCRGCTCHAFWIIWRELIDFYVWFSGRPVFSLGMAFNFGENFLGLWYTVWGWNLTLRDSGWCDPDNIAILVLVGELTLPIKGPQEVLSNQRISINARHRSLWRWNWWINNDPIIVIYAAGSWS